MSYWLCIVNEDNWNVIKQKNVWGVAERHRNIMDRGKPGDKLLIYLKQEKVADERKPPRIVAVYEAASKVFRVSSRIFKTPKGMGNETFLLRIKLKSIKIFDEPMEFKPLIPRLKFITNKRRWSEHLMGKTIRKILKEDYYLLIENLIIEKSRS